MVEVQVFFQKLCICVQTSIVWLLKTQHKKDCVVAFGNQSDQQFCPQVEVIHSDADKEGSQRFKLKFPLGKARGRVRAI